MTNKYKLLIFDVDGTLADTDKMLIETYRTLYELYSPNVKLDESKVIGFSGPPLRETLSTEFPLYDPEFMVKEYKKYSRPNYVKYVTPFLNTRELLLGLKAAGYILTIATSKMHEATLYTLDLLNLNDIFTSIVSSDDVVNPKPDKESVEILRKEYNISKEETLFIGDTKYDVICATSAEVDSVIMTYKARVLGEGVTPTYFATSSSELAKLLNVKL
ncbi:MAG: HAD family hydrolase [Bacilli bacterium]